MALKSKNKVSTEFSLASMTDIVFLLLIFFMLTSQIVTPLGLQVNLPSSKVSSMQTETITISVDKDLNYALNGDKMPENQIEGALKGALSSVAEKDRMVILKIDKEVPVEHFVKLAGLAASQKAKVTIATKAE